MLYLRLIRLLERMALVLRRLPLKDRWGFNLGDDFYDWISFKRFDYLLKVEKASGLERVETVGPPCKPNQGFHVGSNIRITWPEPGGSCDKCGIITYTTNSAA